VLTAGAEDMQQVDDNFEITTGSADFDAVVAALEAGGITATNAEVRMIPENEISLDGKDAEKMIKLMEILEDHDDIQSVSANFDIADEIIERVLG